MPALLQFENYMDKIISEIQSFPSDAAIWQVPPGIANSAGIWVYILPATCFIL
jgi:hypothetical protein